MKSWSLRFRLIRRTQCPSIGSCRYLQEIGDIVGVAHDMHLVRIDASSTKPVFKMPAPMAIEAREQAVNVQRGEGTIRQRRAYERIRHMVRRDGGRPASLKDRTGVILSFPPEPETSPIVGIRQATAFDGILLRVGGAGEFTPILMQGWNGEVYSGFSAARSLAKEMAPRIFDPIRVSGIASWDRNQSGEWVLGKMLIQTYEPLENENLEEVLRQLRAAPVVWPPDVDDALRAERESAI